MASSVHYKFKSQKEFVRVAFDGTGISVFELKREIISLSRLGDGSDFELAIHNAETGEEYDDDTYLVPRTTRVICRRLPAARPGKGGAARYVSGRMPVNAKSNSRIESAASAGNAASTPTTAARDLGSAQSEEDKIKALLNLQESQWKVQQEEMANATPVMMGRGRGKPQNVPDHPPPPGYLCYRCREKGHWIQACPTNNDPTYDGHYRVKRSTGIPRSLQTRVERPDGAEGDGEDAKVSGVMVNADGDFVIAQPDKASWELYQEKAKAAAAAASEAAAVESSREIEARGLQCPLDKRMFLEPTKTPCCGRTYCLDCITNALIDSDFRCPGCSDDGILLDDLIPDSEMADRIREYKAQTDELKKRAQATGEDMEKSAPAITSGSSSPVATSTEVASTVSTAAPAAAATSTDSIVQIPMPSTGTQTPITSAAAAAAAGSSRKRPAEDEGDASAKQSQSRQSSPPSAKRPRPDESPSAAEESVDQTQTTPATQAGSTASSTAPVTAAAVPATATPAAAPSGTTSTAQTSMPAQQGTSAPQSFPPTPYAQQPYGNAFNGMPLQGFAGGAPGMPYGMPGFMPGMPGQPDMWNMAQMGAGFGPMAGFPPGMMEQMMAGGAFMPGFGANGYMNQQQHQQQQQQQQQQAASMYYGAGPFANQQRNVYVASGNEEEQPYLRQPVNPHRHQGRQKRLRPTEYREL